MSLHALVIRHREANWESLKPERRESILSRYYEWMDSLESDGVYRGSHALRDGGRILQSDAGEVTDGPFVETKEIVGGFVLIEAADFDDATRIARGCPALEIGDAVEVRQVSQHERPRKEGR